MLIQTYRLPHGLPSTTKHCCNPAPRPHPTRNLPASITHPPWGCPLYSPFTRFGGCTFEPCGNNAEISKTCTLGLILGGGGVQRWIVSNGPRLRPEHKSKSLPCNDWCGNPTGLLGGKQNVVQNKSYSFTNLQSPKNNGLLGSTILLIFKGSAG